MPLKDPKKRREYHARYMKEVWYPKNKKKHIAYMRKNKIKIREFIADYKKNGHCTDCHFSGKDFPQVLDFDHLHSKEFEIGSWEKKVLSIEKVEEEIKKCELVCANCHRIRTLKRKEVKRI